MALVILNHYTSTAWWWYNVIKVRVSYCKVIDFWRVVVSCRDRVCYLNSWAFCDVSNCKPISMEYNALYALNSTWELLFSFWWFEYGVSDRDTRPCDLNWVFIKASKYARLNFHHELSVLHKYISRCINCKIILECAIDSLPNIKVPNEENPSIFGAVKVSKNWVLDEISGESSVENCCSLKCAVMLKYRV